MMGKWVGRAIRKAVLRTRRKFPPTTPSVSSVAQSWLCTQKSLVETSPMSSLSIIVTPLGTRSLEESLCWWAKGKPRTYKDQSEKPLLISPTKGLNHKNNQLGTQLKITLSEETCSVSQNPQCNTRSSSMTRAAGYLAIYLHLTSSQIKT